MPIWLTIVILGIVEGITEFLPVSSTGHLLIVEQWLPPRILEGTVTQLFNIVIQSGAVLAVLPLFPERLHQFFFRWKEPATRDYLLKILVAFFITGVGGMIMEKKGLKLPEQLLPVAIALFVGGVLFLIAESRLRGRQQSSEVTWTIAVIVGVGQLIAAAFPGTSRSGITIILALMLGLSRVAATEFTFLVGIPTMLAAGGLKIFKALHHPPPGASPENWGMVGLGFVVSAVVSVIAVKWLLGFVKTHTFVGFGYYRIALAGFLGLLIMAGYPKKEKQEPSQAKPQVNRRAPFSRPGTAVAQLELSH